MDSSTIPPNSLLSDLPRAPELLFGNSTADKELYWDRSHYESPDAQMAALEKSSTLYIGNMAFTTRSLQLRAHFAQVGPVKTVHMGLDRFKKTPCGFAFVEYYHRSDALEAVASLSGTKLDGKVIRVELDAGFRPGRELGRGKSGGQIRHDHRSQQNDDRGRRRDTGGGPPSNFSTNRRYEGNTNTPRSADVGGTPNVPNEGYSDNSRFREE